MKTMTASEYERLPAEYRGIREDGAPMALYLDDDGATVYGPVTVIDEREALERIADRIEAGELVSDKSMSDREFLAPLLDEVRCDQCGDAMNPAARMLGPVCGVCCRRNQRAATG